MKEISIVYNSGGFFTPSCIKSQATTTTVAFHGLSPKARLWAMKDSGKQPNPIAEGEPHEADFVIEHLNGGPYGFYIEGQGSDGPPGQTGIASGAIYLTSATP